jgi:cytochrome c-type biogenesis protein CcmH/NrfF
VSASRRALRRSWFPWILLGVVLVLALAVGGFGSMGPTTNEDRVQDISRTIKCPECRGETVAESNSGISQQIRIEIAKLVQSGATDDQIRADIGAHYNNAVLLTPESGGVAGLVWIIPVVALVAALAALAVTFRQWGEATPRHASDADRALVAAALAQGGGEGDGHGEGDTASSSSVRSARPGAPSEGASGDDPEASAGGRAPVGA